MANDLEVAKVHSIQTLRERSWSQRRIARELGIDREMVARQLRLAAEVPKPAKAPPGSPSSSEPFREQILAKLQQG